MLLICATSDAEAFARAAGCTMSANQASSSAVIEQSSVAVELKRDGAVLKRGDFQGTR